MEYEIKELRKSLYYAPCHNFGDELNKHLFEKVFNVKFSYCENIWSADYIAIGSVLGWACVQSSQFDIKTTLGLLYDFLKGPRKYGKLTVLGSGFLNCPEKYKLNFLRKMDYKILRGKLTENYLHQNNHLKNDVLLGDLGLLCSYITSGKINKKYTLGIIPHYIDLNSPIFYDIYKKYDSKCIIINVQDDVDKIITQINECETIISTSLHGLIVSDSFNIPNLWVENTLKYGRDDYFKYRDYYSIYNMEKHYPVSLLDFINKDPYFILDSYKIKKDEIQKKKNELFDYCYKHFNNI